MNHGPAMGMNHGPAMGMNHGKCWANQPEFEAVCENHGFTEVSCQPRDKCHWNADNAMNHGPAMGMTGGPNMGMTGGFDGGFDGATGATGGDHHNNDHHDDDDVLPECVSTCPHTEGPPPCNEAKTWLSTGCAMGCPSEIKQQLLASACESQQTSFLQVSSQWAPTGTNGMTGMTGGAMNHGPDMGMTGGKYGSEMGMNHQSPDMGMTGGPAATGGATGNFEEPTLEEKSMDVLDEANDDEMKKKVKDFEKMAVCISVSDCVEACKEYSSTDADVDETMCESKGLFECGADGYCNVNIPNSNEQHHRNGGGCWANKPEFEAMCENHGFTEVSCQPRDKCHWNAGDQQETRKADNAARAANAPRFASLRTNSGSKVNRVSPVEDWRIRNPGMMVVNSWEDLERE